MSIAVPEKKTSEEQNTDIARVILWSNPRCASTAISKCMAYVADSQVWYEPYLMGYQYSMHSEHRKDVLQFYRDLWGGHDDEEFADGVAGGYLARDKSFSWYKEQLEGSPPNTKLIFSKDMCWAIDGHYEDLPRGFRHTFLIRNPYQVFDSWKRMLNRGKQEGQDDLTLHEVPAHCLPFGGHFKEQYDLYMYVKENIERNPVVIDTNDLLENPGLVLRAYCGAVGIPYSEDLLQWKTGSECMDRLWMVAKEQIYAQNIGNHHKETFASGGFGKPKKCPERSVLTEDVLFYADRAMKYYEEMYANRLIC